MPVAAAGGDPTLDALETRGLAACSRELAQVIRRRLRRALGWKLDRGIHQANFAVLSALRVPGVLVEIGYLDHRTEGPALLTPDYRARATEALAQALVTWARRATHFGCSRRIRSNGAAGRTTGPSQRLERLLAFGLLTIQRSSSRRLNRTSLSPTGR